MSHPMNRLEELLRIWENTFFVDSVLTREGLLTQDKVVVPHTGPLKHWRSLRAHLLEVGGGAVYDQERFSLSDPLLKKVYSEHASFPHFLAEWTRSSRRVFHLTEELQALLLAMSLGEMRWTDILLPFDSFMITLERPILCGVEPFDAMLVVRIHHEDPGQAGIHVKLISQSIQDVKALSDIDKRAWESTVRKGRSTMDRRMSLRGSRDGTLSLEATIAWTLLENLLAAVPLSEGVDTEFRKQEARPEGPLSEQQIASTMNLGFQLLAGLCLYLVSLPPGSPHRSEWRPGTSPGKPDPRSITQTSRVCDLTSSFTLSSEERDAYLGKPHAAGSEKSVHFRRGHFRRARGSGHDPTAPKVVLVRPTLVRADRLVEGAIPGGSLTRVK